jgi:hypothetical protein
VTTAPHAEPAHTTTAGEFSHLDDERGASEGGGERQLPDQFRSSGSSAYGTHYRVRPKAPQVTPAERPAIATLLHLISAEEAYNTKNGHYGSLQDLVRARNALLDVPVTATGFQRRNYHFQVAVEDDGFKVTAVPTAPGLRSFSGDDTGYIKAH